MRITDIVKKGQTSYTIYVDGEYWFIIDVEIIMRNHIKKGMVVDEDFLEEIKTQALWRKTRERAYHLIGFRDHSKKELYDKLTKTSTPEIALEIVTMVEQQGLIDDYKYAQKLAHHYINVKKYGEYRVLMEMSRKGIEKDIAQEIIDELECDVVSQIAQIIERKYSDCIVEFDDYKLKQKMQNRMVNGLVRKGYGYDDIKSAVERCKQELDY